MRFFIIDKSKTSRGRDIWEAHSEYAWQIGPGHVRSGRRREERVRIQRGQEAKKLKGSKSQKGHRDNVVKMC